MEGLADVRNLLQVEHLILPGPTPLLIQNPRDFAITIVLQERVDLGDYVRFRFPDLSDWPGFRQAETTSSAAAETHIHLDSLAVDQCDIFDEQAENTFPSSRRAAVAAMWYRLKFQAS
jgi:hypothetical protein